LWILLCFPLAHILFCGELLALFEDKRNKRKE
jgi:hypothetical protein